MCWTKRTCKLTGVHGLFIHDTRVFYGFVFFLHIKWPFFHCYWKNRVYRLYFWLYHVLFIYFYFFCKSLKIMKYRVLVTSAGNSAYHLPLIPIHTFLILGRNPKSVIITDRISPTDIRSCLNYIKFHLPSFDTAGYVTIFFTVLSNTT